MIFLVPRVSPLPRGFSVFTMVSVSAPRWGGGGGGGGGGAGDVWGGGGGGGGEGVVLEQYSGVSGPLRV